MNNKIIISVIVVLVAFITIGSIFTVNTIKENGVTGAATATCTSSDGFRNYYAPGRTIGLSYDGKTQLNVIDTCRPDGKLQEFDCLSNSQGFLTGRIEEVNYPNGFSCPLGMTCQTVTENFVTGGACKPKYTCTDSDGDINLGKQGKITINSGWTDIDICGSSSMSGEEPKEILNEFFCPKEGMDYAKIVYPRKFSMTTHKYGSVIVLSQITVELLPTESCINREIKVTCTDSDNGKNYEKEGTCTDSTGTFTDSCANTQNGRIIEYYCDAGKCKPKFASCPAHSGCKNNNACRSTPKTCDFSWWPQKIIYVDGSTVDCFKDSRPYCNYQQAQRGIAQCCKSATYNTQTKKYDYSDCAAV